MTPSLQEYIERHKDSEFIGLVSFYSVFDCHLPFDEVKRRLNNAGLKKYTPYKPTANNAFNKAIKDAPVKKVPTDVVGVYANVLVRKVADDVNEKVRQVVVETVDANGRRLDYTPACDVILDRKYNKVVSRPLGSATEFARATAEPVVDAIKTRFRLGLNNVNAEQFRYIIKQALEDSHSVSIRPTGGVFFSPPEASDPITAVQDAFSDVPEIILRTIPLVDDEHQRGMVMQAVTAETERDIDSVLQELRTAREKGASSAKLAALNARYKYLVKRTEEYQQLLGEQLTDSKNRLNLLNKAMLQATLAPAA